MSYFKPNVVKQKFIEHGESVLIIIGCQSVGLANADFNSEAYPVLNIL